MLKDILGTKFCVHTETQEEFNSLLDFLEENGYTWLSGRKMSSYYNYFQQYYSKTSIASAVPENKTCSFKVFHRHSDYYDISIRFSELLNDRIPIQDIYKNL